MLGLWLAAGTALPLACSPQVVDAVDTRPDAGGSGTTGGSGGSGVTGGSAGSGGASVCPDGGSATDRDGDGTVDCDDGCPDDPEKTGFGLCGCDYADPEDGGPPTCVDLVNLLVHRYTFNGVGSVAEDSVGGVPGTILGTELTGTRVLTLAGLMNDQYVAFPNRFVADFQSVTFEAWLQWSGGQVWQRIFDFGNNNGPGAGEQGPNGTSYLFLTPRIPNDPVLTIESEVAPQAGKLRVAYKREGSDEYEVTLDAEIALPSGVNTLTQVVVVIDAEAMRMSLYIDGKLQEAVAHFKMAGATIQTPFFRMDGSYDWSAPVAGLDGGAMMPPAIDLSLIDDANNWLGRSQFQSDEELQGAYHEFRVYNGALSPELVTISFKAGPDPTFFD